ncbi:phosphatase PAP2 family protein [Neotamlana laminarinivorans]|uniref:Phosphatase PAP2 family protein n=1 Tax=Neotamlana laminarinivorans TaxID=2883124 RepID=A0A9X1L2W0_9FLAO|nr:phosphatase PAP2 family protein [Tamlana laminarinivorans]MCB4800188.1 phosphatase PAP2 family protein [Tamlana laminarinivorans]
MIEQLIEQDEALFLFLNNLGSPEWDTLWLIITNKLSFIPLYAVLMFLFYKKFGLKALLIFIVVTALMIAFTDQITNVFKRFYARSRPCRTEGVMEYMRMVASYCGKYGFFSGHSSNTMAGAIFIGLILRPHYKKLIYFMVLWSITVAYSRIYVGVHYPLDILCGMTFGVISGLIFYKFMKYLLIHFNI